MKKEKGYIYIIKLGEYYKIGKSKNFRKRMGEYTQLYATPEIIIVEWVRDYHNFEKRLHRRFKKKNVRGEWFKLSRLEVLFAKILIKLKKGRKNT